MLNLPGPTIAFYISRNKYTEENKMKPHEIYMKKENRDARSRELKVQGHTTKKSSEGPALLHPMYIKDWPELLTEEDKGFGNTIYQTYFSKLYLVEWE